jgi:hypothetical protein
MGSDMTEYYCDKCNYRGTGPPVWDAEVFGGLEVCPKCNWTRMGMLHVGLPWEVLSTDWSTVWDEEYEFFIHGWDLI